MAISKNITPGRVIENAKNILSTMGRAGLHALSPDQFEYYLCSFELLNSQGATVAFMNFPVMPNNIIESESKILEILKTNSGIVTMFNSSFNPKDISLQGTFGRKIRILSGMKELSSGKKTVSDILNGNLGFSLWGQEIKVKTGFGLINLLRGIIQKTTEVDDYKMPYILLFNNYALNTSYAVEILNSSFSQSIENNMLWYYSLEMKAVAPSSVVKSAIPGRTGDSKLFWSNVAANSIAQEIQGILSDSVRNLMQF